MVKLADTQDLESCGAIRIGSNPFDGIRHTPPIRGRGFCVSALSCTLAFSCEPAPLKNPFCRSSFPTFPSKLPQRKRRQRAPFAFLLHFSTRDRLKENADNALPLPSSYIFPPETACETGFRSKTFPIVRLDSTDDAAFILSDFSAPVVQFYNNPFPIPMTLSPRRENGAPLSEQRKDGTDKLSAPSFFKMIFS